MVPKFNAEFSLMLVCDITCLAAKFWSELYLNVSQIIGAYFQ